MTVCFYVVGAGKLIGDQVCLLSTTHLVFGTFGLFLIMLALVWFEGDENV